jgi:1-acyl-sn-glycerol-3-phosphate acyltransferase
MRFLLAWTRFVLVVLCIFFFLSILLGASLIQGKNIQRAFRIRRACVRTMSWILGFKTQVFGPLHHLQPALYLSNHRCFSDPILALNFFYFYPIGKAEIDRYPLIGLASRASGVLFVQRDKKESRHVVKEGIRKAFEQGLNIFLCPEGTTNVGQLTAPFKKGSFEIAAEARVPVIPMAFVYQNPLEDFWRPGDSLYRHFMRQFGKWTTRVNIYFPDKPFNSDDGHVLLQETKAWIDQKLSLVPVPEELTRLARYDLKW